MAEIERYSGNVQAFGSQAQGTERTVFGDVTQADTLDANITADFLRGWGIVGVNENPTKQDFNGLAFTLSQLIAYLHQRGIPEWNASQEYFEGSVVTTLAGVYRLLAGGNGTVNPDTDDGTNWEKAPTRAEIDQRTIYVGSVAEGLSGLTGVDGQAYQINGWHEGEGTGSGYFVFRASVAKSAHNGGTTISPTVPSVSAQAGAQLFERRDAYLNGAGETDPSGTGCFVRVGDIEYYPEMFGAIGDGVADDYGALFKWLDKARGGRLGPVTYATSGTLELYFRQRIIGYETNLWGTTLGKSSISWIGPYDGTVIQAARAPVGTQPTSSLNGVVVKNVALLGNDTAGYGLYMNKVFNGCDFHNISITGCEKFGVLAGNMYYARVSDIVTRNCNGIGQAYGYQWLNSFALTIVNETHFTNLRSGFCGQKYDAVTAPTGFDLIDNPTGGCGILLSINTNSGATNVTSEMSYGAGLVIETETTEAMQGYDSIYLEGNMSTALADGATTKEFGMLISNDVNGTGKVNISNVFQKSGPDRGIYYLDRGGVAQYYMDYAFGVNFMSNVSGPISLGVGESVGGSVEDGLILTNSLKKDRLAVKANDTDDGSLDGRSAVSISAGYPESGWASGTPLSLAKVNIQTDLPDRYAAVTLLVNINLYAYSAGTRHTIAATYLVHVSQFYGGSGALRSSTVTKLSENNHSTGADLITAYEPTVTYEGVTDTDSDAIVQVTPTSTGEQASNIAVASAISFGGAKTTFTPEIGRNMGLPF